LRWRLRNLPVFFASAMEHLASLRDLFMIIDAGWAISGFCMQ